MGKWDSDLEVRRDNKIVCFEQQPSVQMAEMIDIYIL